MNPGKIQLDSIQNQDKGIYNVYSKVAVTASCTQCAQEGLKILSEGGSVVDCAIATLLCAGIKYPGRLGIGGGFVATIFNRQQRKVKVLLARERAPMNARSKMFASDNEALFGGKAVAVPGTLKGYWEMHGKYGKLPWRRLFEPALRMCREGINVDPFTYYGLEQVDKEVYRTGSIKEILRDPFSARTRPQKHKIYRHDLATTLELVAGKGPQVLYNGQLTENLVKDIQNAGGIITKQDLSSYSPRWAEPVKISIPELKINMFTPPPPCSGAIMLFVLQILCKYCPLQGFNESEQWHRLIETFKHAYGFRTRIGDPEQNPKIMQTIQAMFSEDTLQKTAEKLQSHTSNNVKYYGGEYTQQNDLGTFHFNVISSEGDAICVTESINTLFGSLVSSKSTGIILNNTMHDFSLLGSQNMDNTSANVISPGQMPLSSMLPTIVTNTLIDEVKMLVGGAGGTKIISAVSQVLVHHLLLGVNLQSAVDAPRLHHQLLPMNLEYERDFPEEILHQLWLRGHQLQRMKRLAAVSVISRSNPEGKLEAKGDFRRYSANAGF